MGTQLDIDDVCADHPQARAQLAQLRDEISQRGHHQWNMYRDITRLKSENARLRDVENQLLAKIELLRLWITNVATDDQLDAIVPVLQGATGRNLLAVITAKGE